jgi:CheY-like chemotaxis protein
MIDFLEKNLNPQAFALLLLCICAIYIWFLHLRNKLLKEQIEFEKDKRENFLDELNKLKNLPKATVPNSIGLYDSASRILIVDDEPFLRDLLIAFLLQHYPNAKIDQASNGQEAIELIASKKPSLLITDVMMPKMDGIALIKNLQQQGKLMPTLVISGYMTSHLFEEMVSKNKLIKSGGLIFISKPFSSEQFLQALDGLVAHGKK